ncbi:MAG: hypothetical protein JNM94_07735 [Phycisphaerae bacterium]|nr:hypothetical protein [Phycisphaerae bacterium]
MTLAMSMIRSVAAIVAVVVAFVVARDVHGQIMSERLPELPRFAEVRADLEAAGVAVPPSTLVERYAEFVGAWCAEQSDIRVSLARAAGTQLDVVPSVEDADRAVATVRRARSAHEARLEQFATRLADTLPDDERPKLEAVRGWWRIRAAKPGNSLWVFARADDIGDLVRRHALPPDTRDAILTALDTNAAARREAYRRYDKAVGDAVVAAARVAADEGQSGTARDFRDPTRNDFLARYDNARRPDPAALAIVFDTQLAGFDAVAPHLPPSMRRAVFDEIVQQHMGDQMRGSSLRLPKVGPLQIPLQSPAEVGQWLMAWKGLPATARDAVRKTVAEWTAEDDKAVRAYFASRSETMRSGVFPRSFQLPREIQEERGAIAQRRLQSLADASGASWLLAGADATIEYDGTRLSDADRDVMGPLVYWLRSSPSEQATVQRSRSLLPTLPRPEQPYSGERVVIDAIVARTPTDAQDGVRAILTDLFAARVDAWQRLVEPACREAEAADLASKTGTAPERLAAMAKAADARRAAFEASAAADRDLIQSIEAAVSNDHAPFLAAWYASQRFRDGLQGMDHDDVHGSGMDLERLGGALVDLGSLASNTSLPIDAQVALERDLLPEWPRLADSASATLKVRIDADMHRRQVFDSPADDGTALERMQAAGLALRQAADAWRVDEAVLVARLQTAAGDSAPLFVRALREARFPSACNAYVRVRTLRDALRDVADFPARAALQGSLASIESQLESLAERSIALTIPRRTIADLTDDDRWRIDGGRGWRRMDLMLGSLQLSQAVDWLLMKTVPPEIAATSPLLDTTVRAARP